MAMRREEKILLAAAQLWMFGAGLFGPLFAIFTQKVGGDVFSVSWVFGIYMITMGLCTILVGKLSDKVISKAALLRGGYALHAACTFGYLLVDNVSHLLIVQVGLGVSVALTAPAWNALYDKYSGNGKNDGFEWGLASGLDKFTTGVGALLGGMIVATYSFEVLFVIMGCVQVAAFLVQMRLRK